MITRTSIAILFLWALLALFGDLINLSPNEVSLESILAPMGDGSVFGYDDLGRPVFDRLVVGAKTSFVVAVCVVGISLLVGTVVGTISAWIGGWLDHVIVCLIDVFLAFPGILLAIVLAGILGPGIENVIVALSVVGWVGYARLARAQTLSLREREHIQAATLLGVRPHVIMWRHVIPLISAPLIVEASFGVAGVVVAEAGLSFLGLGVQPPAASWGSMIRDGIGYLLVSPHLVIVPSVALALVVLSVNLLGDRLRDLLDIHTN